MTKKQARLVRIDEDLYCHITAKAKYNESFSDILRRMLSKYQANIKE